MAKPSLFHSGKLKRLIKVWKIPRAHCVGHLECLWHAQYERGSPIIGDAEDVELAAEWEGEEVGRLTKALEDCGFIDDLGNGQYQVHDFVDHAPDYVKKRIERTSQRQIKDLQPKAADRRATNGGQRRTLADNGGQRPPPTQPNPTQPNSGAGAPGIAEGKAQGGGTESDVKSERPPPIRKPATGPHADLIRTFCAGWEVRYGKKYPFVGGKDGNHIKWLLDAVVNDLSDAKRIVLAYLADDDPPVIEAGHPLGWLVSRASRYVAGPRPAGRSKHGNYDKRSAVARGEYADNLPVVSRKLGPAVTG